MPKRKEKKNLITEQGNTNQPEQQREINPETMEQSGELWDQIRRAKLHIPHLRDGKESVFEEIKAETVPHFTKVKQIDSGRYTNILKDRFRSKSSRMIYDDKLLNTKEQALK